MPKQAEKSITKTAIMPVRLTVAEERSPAPPHAAFGPGEVEVRVKPDPSSVSGIHATCDMKITLSSVEMSYLAGWLRSRGY